MAATVKKFSISFIVFALTVLLLVTPVRAHATLVFGELTSDPVRPQPGEPFTLRLEMFDPTEVPVEDAVVLAEFTREGSDEPQSVTLSEASPGFYEAQVTLEEGNYNLLLRDQTFRQEEAKAETIFTLQGDDPLFVEGESTLMFPPTATTSPTSVRTWLIWVIALPVVAGIVVTVIVLRGSNDAEA